MGDGGGGRGRIKEKLGKQKKAAPLLDNHKYIHTETRVWWNTELYFSYQIVQQSHPGFILAEH